MTCISYSNLIILQNEGNNWWISSTMPFFFVLESSQSFYKKRYQLLISVWYGSSWSIITQPTWTFSSQVSHDPHAYDWQIAEIIKDRPAWFHDCRNLEVFTMFPTGNGGTIELVYMQVSLSDFFYVKTLSFSIFRLFFCFVCFTLELGPICFGTDVCSDYISSCTGLLDPKVHYKLRRWQSCGMLCNLLWTLSFVSHMGI